MRKKEEGINKGQGSSSKLLWDFAALKVENIKKNGINITNWHKENRVCIFCAYCIHDIIHTEARSSDLG